MLPANSWGVCLQEQNTAGCRPIPGEDGGRLQKLPREPAKPSLCAVPEADQSAAGPSTQSAGIRQTRGILANRSGLFPACAVSADRVPGLLPATQSVVPVQWRPTRQDGECLPAKTAKPAPHTDAVMLPVVRLLAPLTVSNDGCSSAQRTPTWHLLQADPGYPGTALSSAVGNEIKRITAGVKACRWVLPARIGPATGLHPPGIFKSNENKNTAFCD